MNPMNALSGWQGMAGQQGNSLLPGQQSPMNPVDQSILGAQSATGPYQVQQSPTLSQIQPGGSPSMSTMAPLAMLAMMA